MRNLQHIRCLLMIYENYMYFSIFLFYEGGKNTDGQANIHLMA